MEKIRETKWDNLKAILIFLVVLGHLADFYTKSSKLSRALFFYIYLFHMPLFIFISGLFGKRYVRERQYGKITFFLFLYIIFKMLNNIPGILFDGTVSFSLWTEGGTPWYCLALFAYYLMTIAVERFSWKFILIFSVLLACFVGYDSSVNAFLVQSRIIVFFPFFYLGYILDRQKVEEFLSARWVRILGGILLVGVAVYLLFSVDDVYWVRGYFTGQNPFSNWKGRRGSYGGIVRLLCYLTSVLMGAAVIAVVPRKMGKLVATVGRRSLEVYALHVAVYSTMYRLGLQTLMETLLPGHPKLLIFPVAGIITLICSWSGFEKLFLNLRSRCFRERA